MPKRYWEKCVRGKLLRKVIAEGLPDNVVMINRRPEQALRLQLIEVGKASCVAKCGGCPLTEDVAPPEIIRPDALP